ALGILLLAVSLMIVVGRWYRTAQPRSAVPRSARRVMMMARCGAIALIAFMLLGPAWVRVERQYALPKLIVLRDVSQSMSIVDAESAEFTRSRTADERAAAAGRSRLQLVDELLSREAAQVPRRWSKLARLRLIDFAVGSEERELVLPAADRSSAADANTAGSKSVDAQSIDAQSIDAQSIDAQSIDAKAIAGKAGAWPPGRADGRGTELAAALQNTIRGESPVGVVLFSDGQANGPEDLAAVAAALGQRGVPVFAVGMGSSTPPRNIAVTAVYVRPRVWKGEAYEVEAWLTATHLTTTACQVELYEIGLADDDSAEQTNGQPETPSVDPGNPASATPQRRLVAQQAVRLDANSDPSKQQTHSAGSSQSTALSGSAATFSGSVRVLFPCVAERPGRYRYEVRAVPLPEESTADDNQRTSTPLEVLDRDQLRTLVVGGAPTWDFQLLERVLPRDPTLGSSFWLQLREGDRGRGGNRPIPELPATRDELFSYDVLILLDPDPDDLTIDWSERVAEFVEEHRGGLLYVPGPHHAARWIESPGTAAIRTLLPVAWPDAESIAAQDLLDTHARGWPLGVVAAEREHPVLRELQLQRDDASGSVSDAAALNVSPAANSSLPTTLSMPRAPVYWSFPITSVRPTARVLLEHGDPSLRTAQGLRPLLVVDRYRAANVAYLGTQGTWRWLAAANPAANPAATDAAAFTWGERLWLQLIRFLAEGRAEEGEPEGSLTEEDEAALAAGPRRETTATWLDRERMQQIAERSGGRYFEWWQLDQLTASLPDRREVIEMRQAPQPVWDRGWWLLSVVGLLVWEWSYRRRVRWQ
ncbi:MAG: hypothetical protein ACKOUR_03455, partial [Planctomycetota bacterium]